jgi:hypothetical protein
MLSLGSLVQSRSKSPHFVNLELLEGAFEYPIEYCRCLLAGDSLEYCVHYLWVCHVGCHVDSLTHSWLITVVLGVGQGSTQTILRVSMPLCKRS